MFRKCAHPFLSHIEAMCIVGSVCENNFHFSCTEEGSYFFGRHSCLCFLHISIHVWEVKKCLKIWCAYPKNGTPPFFFVQTARCKGQQFNKYISEPVTIVISLCNFIHATFSSIRYCFTRQTLLFNHKLQIKISYPSTKRFWLYFWQKKNCKKYKHYI